MKDIERKPSNLTSEPQTPYSRGGDILMAEPGQGEQPVGVDEATRRLEEAARQGEERRSEQSMGGARQARQQPEIKTGSATWKAKDADYPINVTGYLGRASDGREYVSVEGSTVGVPLDEIEFPTPATETGGADGADGGGREPPAPPAPPPEDGGSGERNQNELNINAEEIESPILKQHVDEVNKFLGPGSKTIEDYANLRKRINELEAPENISNADKARFEQDKQKLLGAISEAMNRAIPADQRGERIRKSLELQEVMEKEDYDAVDMIVRSMDIDDYYTYAPSMSDVIERLQGKGKDYMIEYLLEFGVERIISIADINPKVQYPQFNLNQSLNLDAVTQIARRYDESRGDKKNTMFKYLTDLKTKRYAMHELFRSMKNRESYVRLVTELLRQDGLGFVEKEIVGVTDVKILYEQVLGAELSFKSGWLGHKDFERADREVMTIFSQDALSQDNVDKKFVDDKGVIRSRPLREWEINRAALVGRSLHAASQRRLTYAVMGDVPKGPKGDVDEMLKSIESEFLARILAPFKLIPERFFSWPIALRWQALFFERQKRNKDGTINNQKYGYIDEREADKEKKAKGLYGKRQDSLAILDLGITDPQSNAWRSRLLFIKQKSYSTETLPNGDKAPIGLYLDEMKRRAGEEAKNELGEHASRHKKEELASKKFNESVRENIKKQRIFLGYLMRYPGLDNQNKLEIWENAVKRIPSRIAAFFPEETIHLVKEQYNIADEPNDNEQTKTKKYRDALDKWNRIKVKLWRAERARVKNDAEALRTNDDGERIGQGIVKELSDFYNLDEKEQNLVRQLIDFGRNKLATDKDGKSMFDKDGKPIFDVKDAKGGLINVVFPFTAFLDDAPKTDWENLADEDYDRILVNDHSDFQEGYGKIIVMISNSAIKPEGVIKAFVDCFEKIKSPLGVSDAQKRMEPIVSTQLSMSKMNNLAKWIGPIMKVMREPRSEIERFNLKAEIAQGAKDQSDILDGVAQHEVISDNPEEADEEGKTQLMAMKEEHKANMKAVLAEYIRLILFLLGPVFGLQFLKMVLPEEFSKSLV